VAVTLPTLRGPPMGTVVALPRKFVIRRMRVAEDPGATSGTPVQVTEVSLACLPKYTFPEPAAPAAIPGVPRTCPL